MVPLHYALWDLAFGVDTSLPLWSLLMKELILEMLDAMFSIFIEYLMKMWELWISIM